MPFAVQPPPAPPAVVSAAPPTAAQAAEIEARYVPPGWSGRVAGPVVGYARSYWRDAADPDVIVGQYVAGGTPGVRLVASVREVGLIADGGCGVVNVRYRLSSHELYARCGGR